MKSIEEINREFRMPAEPVPAQGRRRGGGCSFLLVIPILAGLIFAAHTIGGFSWFRVESPSMQREIPQGALVVVRRTDPGTIKIGDAITYIRSGGGTLTPKVVDIIKDGTLSFKTQGVENEHTDPELVPAKKIVGVVCFHIAGAGDVLDKLGGLLPAIILTAFVVTAFVMRRRSNEPKRQKEAVNNMIFEDW
jgi:signal peptidase